MVPSTSIITGSDDELRLHKASWISVPVVARMRLPPSPPVVPPFSAAKPMGVELTSVVPGTPEELELLDELEEPLELVELVLVVEPVELVVLEVLVVDPELLPVELVEPVVELVVVLEVLVVEPVELVEPVLDPEVLVVEPFELELVDPVLVPEELVLELEELEELPVPGSSSIGDDSPPQALNVPMSNAVVINFGLIRNRCELDTFMQ